jgi:hypothetical protein
MRSHTLLAGLTAASVLAAIGLAPRRAAAQAPVTEVTDARAYFNAGARAYAAGRYPAAIRAFDEAYRIEPRPGLVFSIAQAYRRQYFIDRASENLLSAIRHYRRYLDLDPDGTRRGDTAAALSELEPLSNQLGLADASPALAPKPVTQLMISSPTDDVAISLDGAPAGTLPYIATVSPGPHHVTLTARGYLDYQRDVRVLDGSVVPLDVALEEKPTRVHVEARAGSRIAVDGRFRGVTPAQPLELAPGRHVVTVSANGHEPFSREIDVQRDEARTFRATLSTTTQRATSLALLGTGGVAFLAGAGLMTAALLRERHAEHLSITTEDDVRAYDDALATRNQLRTAGVVTSASGVAVAALGLFLFAFDEPRAASEAPLDAGPRERPRPRAPSPTLDVSAVPWVWPSVAGAGASIRGTF